MILAAARPVPKGLAVMPRCSPVALVVRAMAVRAVTTIMAAASRVRSGMRATAAAAVLVGTSTHQMVAMVVLTGAEERVDLPKRDTGVAPVALV